MPRKYDVKDTKLSQDSSSIEGSVSERVQNSIHESSTSSALFLVAAAIGVVVARYVQYLWPTQAVLKGQPASIVVTYIFALLVIGLWIFSKSNRCTNRAATLFLGSIGLSWFVHLLLAYWHGDNFNHTAWLVLPFLTLLWFKWPTQKDVVIALRAFGWTVAIVLITMRVLEIIGVTEVLYTSPRLIGFEEKNYWLPLANVSGIDGRWPGPYGHNGDTGAMAALLIIVGAGLRRWSGTAFITVGVITLLLTSTRVANVAAVSGIAILFLCTDSRFTRKVSLVWRTAIGFSGVALVLIVMLSQSTSLTGRTTIWPAFIDAWLDSPLTGAGTTGFANTEGLTQVYFHAHNLFLDDLTRNGVIGLAFQSLVLVIAVTVTVKAAKRKVALPLALLVGFITIGMTQVPNDWIHPSVFSFLVFLGAILGFERSPIRKELL